MSAERERRSIKLLILSLLIERHCDELFVRFEEHYGGRTRLDEIAGISLLMLKGDAQRRVEAFAFEMLWLLGLRLINYPTCNVRSINLHEVAGAKEMVERLPDQSPRALIDTVMAPDEAYGGLDMIEMIRIGDIESYDRCLRQLEGDGFG